MSFAEKYADPVKGQTRVYAMTREEEYTLRSHAEGIMQERFWIHNQHFSWLDAGKQTK